MNTLSARRLSRQIAEEQANLDGVNRLLGKERFWEQQYEEQIQALKDVRNNLGTLANAGAPGGIALSAEVEEVQKEDDASAESGLESYEGPATPSPTPLETDTAADIRVPPPATTSLSQGSLAFDPSLIGSSAAHLTRPLPSGAPTVLAPLPSSPPLNNPDSIPSTVRPGTLRAAVIRDLFHPRSAAPKNTSTSLPSLHAQAKSAVDLSTPPTNKKSTQAQKSFSASTLSTTSTTPTLVQTIPHAPKASTSIPQLQEQLKELKLSHALAKQTLRNEQALNWERRKSIVELGEQFQSDLANGHNSNDDTPTEGGNTQSSVSLVEDALHGGLDDDAHALEGHHKMAVRDDILEGGEGIVGPLQFKDGVLDRAEGVPGTLRDWNEAAEVREGRA
ncbi:hypothetical protein HK097_006442 [Rhizophlyctis rosea]|uniref:Uncharacterized protein n=1 Tax=Rhizophlyctis rosea TaxID=64517 RepID=A0AAD5SFZ4_9FUNG|nr:hypothetical protein HK097_006442 [Rhizophlyctis rosea]